MGSSYEVLGGASNGKNSLIEHIEELRAKKDVLIDRKGKRLAEKLGTKWYNEGEKSTRYFLRLLNRPAPDKFESIIKENGEEEKEEQKIEEAIVNFYKDLYEKVEGNSNSNDLANAGNFFDNIEPVSDEAREAILGPITEGELWATLGSCDDSAPGPDGIPYSFIRELWPHMGKLILEAWTYSQATGKLSTSHRCSFLRLIPKAGKDLKELKNWRPITLSNCDHKLITKAYAKRMSDNVAAKIKERQTAYLKGRLINDNIRSIMMTMDIANVEKEIDGLLVSLDAKKAFDSVSHEYIQECLKRFGLEDFVPIFKILYNELKSDILVNGKVIKGFNIKRGVKQGDALSCILFIMCMEPLLRNIERNERIEPLKSRELNVELPKVYAYADDVNGIIKNSPESLQALFEEYERLTQVSGLELNADKTEIMRINADQQEIMSYRVKYLESEYEIKTQLKTKINGILFQQNRRLMLEDNVDNVVRKIDKIFKTWSRRNLSILGKILIVKTFGISQVIFLMQSLVLANDHFKRINAIVYKFIWNRHYLAAKAPERINRETMTTPIKNGGFGMLDLASLDNSLKLRALGRIIGTLHPMLQIFERRIEWSDFCNIRTRGLSEAFVKKGIELLNLDRGKIDSIRALIGNRNILSQVGERTIQSNLTRAGKTSLPYFIIRRSGAVKIKDLDQGQFRSIERFMDRRWVNVMRAAVGTNLPLDEDGRFLYYGEGQLRDMRALSSKIFRQARDRVEQRLIFKIGLILTPLESSSWCLKISKLTSVSHKSTLLRIAHGDIYTRAKLFRYNLTPDDQCKICGDTETLEHKFITCPYAQRIWHIVRHTRELRPPPHVEPEEEILGAWLTSDMLNLTVRAEILQRLTYMRESNYVVHPRVLVRSALESLKIKEKDQRIKMNLEDILSG